MAGGELVVIKRSGRDGMRYPLPSGYVTLGRDADCHIRVLLPSVSELHATVTVHRNQSVLRNVSSSGETLVNGAAVSVSALRHGDVITLGDRSLRWEYYAPGEVRAQPASDLPPLKAGSARRRRGRGRGAGGGGGGRQRASDAAPRRLESDVKALIELRHRASLPAAGGARQVAIVQPQRRGESAAEPAEIKTKAVSKPTNKRLSRSAQPASSSQSETRKSTRVGGSLDSATARSVSPKKDAKKPAKTPKKTDTPAKTPKGRTSKSDTDKVEAKAIASTSKESPKKPNKEENKPESPKKKHDEVETPRKSARKALTNNTVTAKDDLKIDTPRGTPARNKLGLDFSNVVPTDLAAVAARGTPKRATPKGPFVHVATPRPKTPYVERSPASAKRVPVGARGTPRVNPLLRAATLRATPRAAEKAPSTTKALAAKRTVIQKIEDPANIDAQKKSALMALTGRSPKKAVTPHTLGKTSPKFIIAKASIKKISPSRLSPKRGSRGPGSASKRKRVTGTPKLTPGSPVVSLNRYTPSSETGKGQKRSLMNSQTANDSIEITDLTKETPAKLRKSADALTSLPPSRNSLRSATHTPTVSPDTGSSPRKSVLKTPSSPRKMEKIKFDLSNIERKRSVSLTSPKKDSPTSSPAKTRGRSSLTSVDVTSEEDLLLRFSDESSGSESPSTKRPRQAPSPRPSNRSQTSHLSEESLNTTSAISERISRTRSPSSKSQSPSTPRKSSRGSLLVQKVLETPVVVASPSPSDRSSRSSYSRMSTLTKSQFDASSVVQSPNKTLNATRNVTKSPEKTPNVTKSPKSTQMFATDSYSIVDLVSINTTHSVDETDSTYDSFSSVNSSTNSRYGTPAVAKSGRYSTSRGQNLTNLSLETSTPVVKQAQRLSARSALLKSATIASAIKRSRSIPTAAARKSSPTNRSSQNTPKASNKRSKSLSLSPEPAVNQSANLKRSSRGKSEIIIDDSALSDFTITPNTRVSKASPRTANTTGVSPMSTQNTPKKPTRSSVHSPPPSASKNTPTKSQQNSKASPNKKTPRSSKSNTESPLHLQDASLSLRKSSGQSPVNSSISGISPTRSPRTSKTSPSKKTPLLNGSIKESPLHSPDASHSLRKPSVKSPVSSIVSGISPTQSQKIPKTSPSKKTPRLSKSIKESSSHSPDACRSLRKSTVQSPVNSSVSGISPTRSSLSGTPVKFSKIATPNALQRRDQSNTPASARSLPSSVSPTRSRKSASSPSNKRRSASLGDVTSASKKRTISRGSKMSPKLQVGRHSGKGDGPGTPDNTISPNEAGTPVLNIQNILNQSQEAIKSVKETIKRFEAIRTSKTSEQPKKVTRKTLGAIGERILARRSDLERQGERKGWTDPKKIGKGITKASKSAGKIYLSAVKKVLTRTRTSKRNIDENSVASDKTDENAPKPDNEIVITPKSTIQLVPEAVKGKHSTAKKPVSRKSIIDHLDISQDIVKNLFNSPVKRMLSQSMTQYSISQLSDDEANTSSRSKSKRSTLGKTPNVSFDFDSIKTPGVPPEMFVSPMDTPTPPSPNLVGVKRLYARNTPKNDLTNLRGVKALLKTPKIRKSPKNDLTNIAGVKALLRSTKKGKAPKNDLSNISGVKELLGSVKKQRSPKNDLTEVIGVKGLFATGSKKSKSPKNDLRNVAGVKRLLRTPKGKPKSPKNDLTDVRGVKRVFRRNKSIQNALDDLSGIEELFGASISSIRHPDNTMTEFDKLVGSTPVKSYSRAKSLLVKKPTPAKQKFNKSLDADVSQSNVEEWLDKELAMRSKKSVKDTSIGSVNKTPLKAIKISEPKSARLERALKKLTINAVGGDVSVTPDRRSRRALTAEKSNFSIEVAKALTPTKKKLSIPEILEERSSLPFKKRGYSNERKSKTPKKSMHEVLGNSAEALVERLSLPIKKRVLKSQGALGHSTPVKNRRAKSKADDADSVDLGHVSPITSSPNVTPKKSMSPRDIPKSAKRVKSSQESVPVNQEANLTKATQPASARGRNSRAQTAKVDLITKSPSLSKAAPKTRGRRGTKTTDSATEVISAPKKTTRSRKAAQKDETENTSKTASPIVPVAKPTRGKKAMAATLKSVSPKSRAQKSRGRKQQNLSVTNTTGSTSLVVSKKAPKLSPEKPKPKATRGRRGAPKADEINEPSPIKSRGRKAVAETTPVKTAPKATRSRKAVVPENTPDEAPVKGRRKRQNEDAPEVSSPKVKPTRGRGRGTAGSVAEVVPESPKKTRGKKAVGSSQKHVSFAPEAPVSAPPLKRAGRRKLEPSVEEPEAEKPVARRGRGARVTVKTPSPVKPAQRRSRQQPAAASPKAAARATRATRQRK